MKQSKSFRLSEQAAVALLYIAQQTGMNQTAIIEKLVTDEALRLRQLAVVKEEEK